MQGVCRQAAAMCAARAAARAGRDACMAKLSPVTCQKKFFTRRAGLRARKKGPPSSAPGASQRKSTLRAAGGKRERWAVDWGGWGCQKGPRCQDRAGLGSCQWSGVGLGLDVGPYFTCLAAGSDRRARVQQIRTAAAQLGRPYPLLCARPGQMCSAPTAAPTFGGSLAGRRRRRTVEDLDDRTGSAAAPAIPRKRRRISALLCPAFVATDA